MKLAVHFRNRIFVPLSDRFNMNVAKVFAMLRDLTVLRTVAKLWVVAVASAAAATG
jgi:hypothetical protein